MRAWIGATPEWREAPTGRPTVLRDGSRIRPQNATQFNADLLDAMLLKLGDDCGPGFRFRFMSVFYPPEEIFLSYANEMQRLTFRVTAEMVRFAVYWKARRMARPGRSFHHSQ